MVSTKLVSICQNVGKSQTSSNPALFKNHKKGYSIPCLVARRRRQDVLKMVILVTMMWEASTAEGQSCEWELINTIDFWGRW